MAARFQLKRARNGQHFFNLVATNGEIILTSEMYSSMTGAKKGIASVQRNCKNPDRYDRRKGKRGKSHFVLKAANHRVIGCSEIYESQAALEKGIKSVMKNGHTETIAAWDV